MGCTKDIFQYDGQMSTNIWIYSAYFMHCTFPSCQFLNFSKAPFGEPYIIQYKYLACDQNENKDIAIVC